MKNDKKVCQFTKYKLNVNTTIGIVIVGYKPYDRNNKIIKEENLFKINLKISMTYANLTDGSEYKGGESRI